MEDIRCPVCGETNSSASENCKKCGELLRQTTSELDGAGKLIDSGQSPTAKKTSELESALPAWLKNARKGENEEAEEEAPPPVPAAEDKNPPSPVEEPETADDAAPLDWLAGLDDEDEEEDEESADWLVNLQGDLFTEEAEEAPPGIPAADEPITAGDAPRLSDEEEEPIKTGELPGWVSDLQDESAEEEAEPLPDLFEKESSETSQEFVEDVGDAKSGELPDWLSDLSKEESSTSPSIETSPVQPASVSPVDADSPSIDPEESLPDWMSNLQADATTEEEPAPPVIEEDSQTEEKSPLSVDDDLPDWMSGLQSDAVTEEITPEEESAPTTVASDEDLPDWMSDRGSTSDAPPPVIEEDSQTEESPLRADDDLPDWMSGLQSDAATETSPEEEATPVVEDSQREEPSLSADDDLPDWMSDIQSDGAEEITEEPSLDLASDDDAPDWLSSLPAEDSSAEDASLADDLSEKEASQQESVPSVESAVDADETETPLPTESDLPDWLSKMEKPATGSLAEVKPEETPAFSEGDAPDWLESLPSVETSGDEEVTPSASASSVFVGDDVFSDASEDDTDEIFGIEMPDWLSSLGPEDADAEASAEAEASEGDEDLSSEEELPSWVQAMRPVASVVSGSSDDESEHIVAETGPLAGLTGVLPASPGLGELSKPRAHSIKLQVSESQQSSAAMLEGLLAGEAEPISFSAQEKTSSIPVLRWVIAILLFFVVGSSLSSQTRMVSSPNMEIPEIRDAINIVNQLPGGGSTLLIFDYEAGFSGEMGAVAAPLVMQLLSRGENLAIISTSPTGPVLAENFLGEIQKQSDYELQAGANYRNLGYIPGGASGMLSFISNPQATLHKQVDQKSVWDLPPLEGVNRFSDFSVVVILTEDVEKGRTWVEQSTTFFGSIENAISVPPILMAISAQAEPIIYPYYASGQVSGLVSGLSGGATYERMLGQNGFGRKYWDSYSVGLLLAEIMIAIGAMTNLLVALRARQKTPKEEN
mgnify:CR=1 FL=1